MFISHFNRLIIVILIKLIVLLPIAAQQYHAIHGSSYAGVSSAFNNPASIGNSLHRWDIQLFSGQTSIYTNTVYAQSLKNAVLGRKGTYLTNGLQARELNINLDMSMFSAMYRINKKHAVSFAFRGKMYNHAYVNELNHQDSISSIYSLFKTNRTTPFMELKTVNASWGEVNLTYAGAIAETNNSRLTIGGTLQISKSFFGGYANMSKLRFRESINGIDTNYFAYSGLAEYGYSSNVDVIQNTGVSLSTVKSFLKQARTSVGLSIGLEYLQYDDENDLDKRNYGGRLYNYKIGFSIVDIGAQKFNNSPFTGRFIGNNRSISPSNIASAFRGVDNAQELRDSLTVLFDSAQALPAQFNIGNPTRAILNFDKQIKPNFFVNTQMVVHLGNTKNSANKQTNDYSFITITPRWENLNWGIYLPMQYTRDGQAWVGFAIKAGPFIGGIHRIGIIKQRSLLNGGGYILLNIHPFRKKEMKSRIDCFE